MPDVAGAVAVMYNVDDKAGGKVDYLHLSMRTIARIFTGDISNWSDPAISADNKGLRLPNQPITVVYRGGQSGTTGLFYDFIAHVAPDIFGPWVARNQFPTTVRIIQLDSSPTFAPKTYALGGSDQIAQVRGRAALGSGASRTTSSGTPRSTALPPRGCRTRLVSTFSRTRRTSLPRSRGRSSTRTSARSSRECTGAPNPAAYPISAYSYMVPQCAATGDRPTCKGAYANGGISETLTKWWRYIACDGQVNMARHRVLAATAQPLPGDGELNRTVDRDGAGDPDAWELREPTVLGIPGRGLAESRRSSRWRDVHRRRRRRRIDQRRQLGCQSVSGRGRLGRAAASVAGKAGGALKSAGGGSTDYGRLDRGVHPWGARIELVSTVGRAPCRCRRPAGHRRWHTIPATTRNVFYIKQLDKVIISS